MSVLLSVAVAALMQAAPAPRNVDISPQSWVSACEVRAGLAGRSEPGNGEERESLLKTAYACSSFADGAIEAMRTADSYSRDGMRICLPAGVDHDEIIQLAVKLFRENPDLAAPDTRPVEIIQTAALLLHPCK